MVTSIASFETRLPLPGMKWSYGTGLQTHRAAGGWDFGRRMHHTRMSFVVLFGFMSGLTLVGCGQADGQRAASGALIGGAAGGVGRRSFKPVPGAGRQLVARLVRLAVRSSAGEQRQYGYDACGN
jgi:hypothetical protein